MNDFRGKLKHAAHRQLFDYWRSKATADALPGRQLIDPAEIPDLLPWIGLVDVLQECGRVHFRYRLVGTGIVAQMGRDPTGKRFDKLLSGHYLQTELKTYRKIVTEAYPAVSRRTQENGKPAVTYDRLILPLASDGKIVDMLIYLIVFKGEMPVRPWSVLPDLDPKDGAHATGNADAQ